MTKTLILMRHGAYDRSTMSLSNLGEQEIISSTKQLIEHKLIPDVIIHSPVTRAVETTNIVRDIFNTLTGSNIELIEMKELRENFISNISNILSQIDDDNSIVLAVSHLPNISDLTEQIQVAINNPHTAEAIVYESEVSSWKDIPKNSKLKQRVKPLL